MHVHLKKPSLTERKADGYLPYDKKQPRQRVKGVLVDTYGDLVVYNTLTHTAPGQPPREVRHVLTDVMVGATNVTIRRWQEDNGGNVPIPSDRNESRCIDAKAARYRSFLRDLKQTPDIPAFLALAVDDTGGIGANLLSLIREAATRMYPPTIDKDGKITDADDRAGDAINKVVTSISVEVHRGRAGMLLKMYRTAVFTSRNVGAIGADGSTVTGPEPIHQRALKGAMRPGATVHKPQNPKPAGKGGRPAKKGDGRKRGHRCATIPRDPSGDEIAGAQPGSEKEPTSPGRDPLVARLFPSTPTGHTFSPPSPSHDQQGELVV